MFKKITFAAVSIVNIFMYYIRYYNTGYVCLFALQTTSLKFMQPMMDQLDGQAKLKYIVLTTTKEYKEIQVGVPVLYIHLWFWPLMKGDLLITGNSGVTKELINGFSKRVHSFHSPISILRVYPSDAFDAYNCFFVAGKHHVSELKYLFNMRGLPAPHIFKTGYMRIESIYNFNQEYRKTFAGDTVIIAPSWGKKNIINLFGYKIIEQLLERGYNVIFRPHPGNERYNAGDITKIRKDFSAIPAFHYDSWNNIDLLCEADIMIGDWSGISFEFSCALDKPVIFIDTEPKDNSETRIHMDVFESYAREKVGRVISVNHINQLSDIVADTFQNYESYQQKIAKNKKELFYNCPVSSTEILASIAKLTS